MYHVRTEGVGSQRTGSEGSVSGNDGAGSAVAGLVPSVGARKGDRGLMVLGAPSAGQAGGCACEWVLALWSVASRGA